MKKTIFTIVSLFLVTPALAAVELQVPFSSQAPMGDWNEPWQNACEETDIMMIDEYYKPKTNLTPEAARDRILEIFRMKEHRFGQSYDETADQVAAIINFYFPWEAEVVEEPTIEDMKNELAFGRPIILPTHGTELRNPYFRTDLLDYHVIVLSGYDDETQEFISRDPGTRHGFDLRYPYARIMDAMHDYVPGHYQTRFGRKVAIFTRPDLKTSKLVDEDQDGLTKEAEIMHGTSLFLADTDNDGYTDKQEVESGYSPLVAEYKLPSNALVKSKDSPKVYVLQKTENRHKKHHIPDEETFTKSGWKWHDILTISEKYISTLDNY